MPHKITVRLSPRASANPPLFSSNALSFSSSPVSTKASIVERLLSVRVLLLASFTLQVLIISGIMYGVTVYSQTKITDDLSSRIIHQVIARAVGITQSSFRTTYLTVKGAMHQMPTGNATLEELRVALWALWLQSTDEIQDIYWGDPGGNCMGYYTPPSREYLVIMYADKSTEVDGYLIPVTNLTDGTGNLNDPNRAVLPQYYVSQYSWYPPAAASRSPKPLWSTVYIDPNFPGSLWFTCSIALWDRVTNVTYGVVSVDLTSEGLSAELQTIKVSANAKIWIMEPDGNLVASSDSSEQSYTSFTDKVYKAQDSNLELIRETTKEVFRIGDTRDNYQFSYKLNGDEINAFYYTILEYNLNLRLVVAYPQSDFFTVVEHAKKVIVIVCLCVLAMSALVGIAIMCFITKPLTQLGQQMDVIAKGIFDASVHQRSTKLYEIHTLQEDFHRMVTALKSFGRFVPVDVVRHLLRNNIEATVAMSQKEVTVMFSDIKNFTRKVEELTPNQLSLMLSDYLNTMCAAISETDGTVDKFIGDAIMALWNVPSPVSNHAVRACQTALHSLAYLDALNAKWTALDLPDVGVRIGIHTGNALVGNLGSAERLAFTAVGDNINLAARLESLNKKYGTSILLSGEVYQQVKDEFLCRYLDVVVVMGKTTHTHIYELVNFQEKAGDKQRIQCEMQAEALEFFLEQNFEESISKYSMLANDYPDDISIKLLLDRAIKAREQVDQLPPDWTGHLILDDK